MVLLPLLSDRHRPTDPTTHLIGQLSFGRRLTEHRRLGQPRKHQHHRHTTTSITDNNNNNNNTTSTTATRTNRPGMRSTRAPA